MDFHKSVVAGVDYGTAKISVAVPSVGVFEDYVLQPKQNITNLAVLAEITWNVVSHTHAEVVAIESAIQGLSRNVRVGISLGMVAGAVAVAAQQAGAQVIMVEPTVWKKVVTGRGNANKEEVSAFLENHHPGLYAHCTSQDMVDATCIALYAQQTLAG